MGAPRPRTLLPWILAPCLLMAEDGEALLRRVDRCRYPWPGFSMEVELKDGKVAQRWRVTVRGNGDARVDGLSEKEKGRSVLLLGDEMWLLLPGAKRPIKVSPQQRLLGSAAGGDIARFRFATDYTIAGEREEMLENLPRKRLDLQARQTGNSYRKAVLWITAEGAPVRCDFYFASGKLARTARFGALVLTGTAQVLSELQLEEPSGRKAQLTFSHWQPQTAEDRLFNLPTPPAKEPKP